MTLKKFWESFDSFPTTRFRILCTLCLIMATGGVYLFHACGVRHAQTQLCIGWEPSLNWLIFLSALAGVDVTQYFARGFISNKQIATKILSNTLNEAVSSKENTNDGLSTSDVSELNNEQELKG